VIQSIFLDGLMMSKKNLGIFCIVPLGILMVTATAYIKSNELIRNSMLEQHRLLCEAVTYAVDNTYTRTRQFVSFAVSMPAMASVVSGHDREQARRLLSNLAAQDREAALTPQLSLLDNKGNVLASSVFTASQAGRSFFQEAVQGRFALEGPEISQATNEATLLLAEPVRQNKQVIGVLVAHLDVQQLSINILPILRGADVDHSFAFALDSAGMTLMHTNFGDLVGISMQDEVWAREMLRRKDGQIAYDWDGTPRIAAFAFLPQPGWVIGVSLRQADLLAPQRAIRNWLLGGGLTVAALALLTLYLLLRKSHFHLRAGSELALTELAGELRLLSGEKSDDRAHILRLGLSVALEKAQQNAVRLERALSNQHERLHAVFTSMMEGILHVDAGGAIVFANPAVLRILRCHEKDVLGKQLRQVILPSVTFTVENDGLSAVYQAVSASQSQTFTGKILRRQDGSHLLADIAVQPLHKDDNADGAVFAIHDASLVDAQRQMLAALSRAAGAMYFIWDEQCRLVDCGDNCITFFLAPGKEAFLKDFARYMPKHQINRRTSASELERHQLHALNTGGDSCDWLFRNELGANLPCDLVFRRFTLCGRPAVLGFARDMRLVVETVEKLASGHSNLRQVLDALPVAVGVIGRGTLLYANHEMEEFFALHGEIPDLAPFSPMLSASFASDHAFLQTIDNRHLQLFQPDGTMHDYMLSCFPTEFGGTAALMGWLVDVTQLKKAEQGLIRARDQALETVKANRRSFNQIEQDIRESLNGIVGALQHAVQTRNETELLQSVDAAYAFCTPLRKTLSRMLSIARVAPPPLVHERTRFEAADFFYEIFHDFAVEAEARDLTFNSKLDPNLPEHLVGDRALLRLLINQLVDNAVQYTIVGGVTVEVALLPSQKTDRVVLHIMVADTGPGISDAQLDALFHPFADGAKNQNLLPATSSGVAMVRSYVRRLKGELCIISEAEHGTEMHLVLPFALKLPAEEPFKAEEEEESLPFQQLVLDATPAKSQGAAKAKGRILVVDDTPTNVKIMLLILQKMGYEAIGADSGANALSLLKKAAFDLVFMDIQMPQMNGMEATVHIRNDRTGRYPRDIPIVAMTAHAMLGDPEKYLAAGMNDYLSKPVIIEDVANILNNLLKP